MYIYACVSEYTMPNMNKFPGTLPAWFINVSVKNLDFQKISHVNKPFYWYTHMVCVCSWLDNLKTHFGCGCSTARVGMAWHMSNSGLKSHHMAPLQHAPSQLVYIVSVVAAVYQLVPLFWLRAIKPFFGVHLSQDDHTAQQKYWLLYQGSATCSPQGNSMQPPSRRPNPPFPPSFPNSPCHFLKVDMTVVT